MNEHAVSDTHDESDDAMRMQEAIKKLDSIQSSGSKKFFDIPVSMQVIIGSAMMPLRELLNMKPGSVIVLDRDIGEPVSICISGKTIASAQIVVCESEKAKLGVSIIEMFEDSTGLSDSS